MMVIAAGLTLAMTPSHKVADSDLRIDLDRMIPRQFTRWQIDDRVIPVAPDPQLQATINRLYSETLSRTYKNDSGQHIMLSIAYGGNQSDSLQVHRPEVCYTAQGFQVIKDALGEILSRFGAIPVRRLVATQGTRYEPITYWVTVGDHVAKTGLDWKLAQLRYGLTGKVPDGMLVRVSSVGTVEDEAYRLHDQFIGDLLAAIAARDRPRFIGRLGG
jgi:EpsI family protein